MKEDAFEQKLVEQELRPLPEGWREEILENAAAVVPEEKPKKRASVRLVSALMSSRLFLIGLTAFTMVGTVGAFVIGFEGQRAKSKIGQVEEMLAAEGESLDMAYYEREPVADELNFMATPSLMGIEIPESKDPDGVFKARRDFLRTIPSLSSGEEQHGLANVRVMMDEERNRILLPESETVLEGLIRLGDLEGDPLENFSLLIEPYLDLIAELREAAKRPRSQLITSIPDRLEPDESLAAVRLAHLGVIQLTTKLLARLIETAYERGEGAIVVDDVRVMLKLGEACGGDRSLIGHLVELSVLSQFFGVLPSLLSEAELTDAQLVGISSQLERIDVMERCEAAYRGELVFSANVMDHIMSYPRGDARRFGVFRGGQFMDPEATPHGAKLFSYLIPDSLFLQNKATVIDWQYRFVLKPLKERDWDGIRRADSAIDDATRAGRWSPYTLFARAMGGVSGGILRRAIETEIHRRLAIAAIGLERERLASGSYPASIDTAPLALGELAIHYAKTSEGYTLTADTWAGTGDDGIVWGED